MVVFSQVWVMDANFLADQRVPAPADDAQYRRGWLNTG